MAMQNGNACMVRYLRIHTMHNVIFFITFKNVKKIRKNEFYSLVMTLNKGFFKMQIFFGILLEFCANEEIKSLPLPGMCRKITAVFFSFFVTAI